MTAEQLIAILKTVHPKTELYIESFLGLSGIKIQIENKGTNFQALSNERIIFSKGDR